MSDDKFFIEQRPDGPVQRIKTARHASHAVTETQAEGIARARELNPDAAIHVERVRDVGPGRDKWRKT